MIDDILIGSTQTYVLWGMVVYAYFANCIIASMCKQRWDYAILIFPAIYVWYFFQCFVNTTIGDTGGWVGGVSAIIPVIASCVAVLGPISLIQKVGVAIK